MALYSLLCSATSDLSYGGTGQKKRNHDGSRDCSNDSSKVFLFFVLFQFEIARIFTIQEELARFGIIYGILGNISGEFDGK